MKFGTMTHIGPLQRIDRYNFEFLEIQDGGSCHFENHKNRDISQRFTDLYEIWYADAKWVSYPPWPLKKFEFHKSKMADGRHFKNR